MKALALPRFLLVAAAISFGSSRPASAVCTPSSTVFCANKGRFAVSGVFSAPNLFIFDTNAPAVSLTADTGYFWFFSPQNVEVVLKVVDGRAFNGSFWVFYGALSDIEYTVTVTDTFTGAAKTYRNAAGSFASVGDVTAFPSGPDPVCNSYSITPPSRTAFAQTGGLVEVFVTTQPGCPWTAVSNANWILNIGPSSFSGSGQATFRVLITLASYPRRGTITVADQMIEITQNY